MLFAEVKPDIANFLQSYEINPYAVCLSAIFFSSPCKNDCTGGEILPQGFALINIKMWEQMDNN